MVAFGEQTIPSGITALFIALMPVWVAIFGRLFLGERLPRMAIVGIIVGFVGVAILVGPSALGAAGALDPLGLAALLLSPISWSLGSLFASHRATLPASRCVATAPRCWRAARPDRHGRPERRVRDVPARRDLVESFTALVYLTVIGSLLAFTRTAGCCASRRCR